jgi:aspartyl protease family protein
MVDTGASAVALNRSEASRLGISYLLEGDRIYVRTASGGSKAYAVKLDSVRLGDIMLRNVDAFVIDGDEPHTVLLGMSYLQRVNIKNDGQVMILEQKY